MSKTVYFDWSIRNGVFTLTDNAKDVIVYPTLWAVLDELLPGDMLIGEATFLSFDVAQRERFMKEAAAKGVAFLTTPTRLTSRARKRHGLGEKSDEVDVRAIRAMVQEGIDSRLKPPAPADPEWVELRTKANRHLMSLRRSGELVPAPRTPGRYKFISGKDTQAKAWAEELPPLQFEPEVRRLALGQTVGATDYNLVIVAAVGVAAIYARDTDEFDRLAGLHAHGYPSQIRADLHHYAWAGGNTRAKLEVIEAVGKTTGQVTRVIPSPTKRLDGLTWTDYRRELRWLYRQLRKVVNQ